MRRFAAVCLVFGLIMLVFPAIADVDWSSMETDEIYKQIDIGKAELTKRTVVTPDSAVLVDADNVTLTLKGSPTLKKSYDGSLYLTFNATLINSGIDGIGVMIDSIYINGWGVNTLFSKTLDAGKKEKDTFDVYNVDEKAELTSLDELETVEFHCHTFNASSFMTITKDIAVTIDYR